MAEQMTPAQLFQMNMQNRNTVLAASYEMYQPIYTRTITDYVAGTDYSISIPIKAVGLTRRFIIDVTATVTAGSGAYTRTPLGPSAFFSRMELMDYSSVMRHGAPSWMFHNLMSFKKKAIRGAAYTTDTPTGIQSVNSVMTLASTLAATTSTTLNAVFEMPCSYSDDDLTGALYTNVVSQTAFLNLKINGNLVAASTGNPTESAYQSASAVIGTVPSITITVYQDYLDNLPGDPRTGLPLLPLMDLSYIYSIFDNTWTGLSANAETLIAYQAYRKHMSTIVMYDNSSVLNAGTDISKMRLLAGNSTPIWDKSPKQIKFGEREIIGDDAPQGVYYLDHRRKPIQTSVSGNMNLAVTPSAVTGSASRLRTGFEFFLQQQNALSVSASAQY